MMAVPLLISLFQCPKIRIYLADKSWLYTGSAPGKRAQLCFFEIMGAVSPLGNRARLPRDKAIGTLTEAEISV